MPIVDGKPRRPNSKRWPALSYRTPGAYFVSFCTRGRVPMLSVIDAEGAKDTLEGAIVRRQLLALNRLCGVRLDEFQIMPDHVHAILWIFDTDDRPSLSRVVQLVKSRSARDINALRGTGGATVWQTSFHDRYIRDDAELHMMREYIRKNPERWWLKHGEPVEIREEP